MNCEHHQTNKNIIVFKSAGEEDVIYFGVSEHYTIIDPNLPYESRFKTHHYTLAMRGEDDEGVERIVSSAELQRAGMMLLRAAEDARGVGL